MAAGSRDVWAQLRADHPGIPNRHLDFNVARTGDPINATITQTMITELQEEANNCGAGNRAAAGSIGGQNIARVGRPSSAGGPQGPLHYKVETDIGHTPEAPFTRLSTHRGAGIPFPTQIESRYCVHQAPQVKNENETHLQKHSFILT